MGKYIFIWALGLCVLGNNFSPALAESIPGLVVTKYSKPEEQQSKTDHDKQDRDRAKGKAIAAYPKKEKSLPNGPFVTTNGSFTTNSSNSYRKYEDRDHRHNRNYGYINVQNIYTPGIAAIIIPADFMSLSYNGQTYYYNQGTFYQLNDRVLAPVPAPIGAIITNIPEDYSTIQIAGDVLFIYRDIFYKKISRGYQVVETPSALKDANS